MLGTEFSVLVQKHEEEIDAWVRKAKGLETDVDILEMQLEAARHETELERRQCSC
jgi:hypothetical protein